MTNTIDQVCAAFGRVRDCIRCSKAPRRCQDAADLPHRVPLIRCQSPRCPFDASRRGLVAVSSTERCGVGRYVGMVDCWRCSVKIAVCELIYSFNKSLQVCLASRSVATTPRALHSKRHAAKHPVSEFVPLTQYINHSRGASPKHRLSSYLLSHPHLLRTTPPSPQQPQSPPQLPTPSTLQQTHSPTQPSPTPPPTTSSL
jgi:hypothetical protein